MSNEQRGRTNHRKCCERLCQFKDGVLLLNFVVDWMAVIIIGREVKSEEYSILEGNSSFFPPKP